MGGSTVLPQEGRLLGDQTGGGTRRARTLAKVECRLRAEVWLHVETWELREELAQRAGELRKGDQLFIERDRELAEVRSQPAELQTVECRRP